MQKQVLSLSLSYQKRAWLAPAQLSLFGMSVTIKLYSVAFKKLTWMIFYGQCHTGMTPTKILRLPATKLREFLSSVAKNLNSTKHFVNFYMLYERLFRYFEQSSITSQFSVSLPAALESLFYFNMTWDATWQLNAHIWRSIVNSLPASRCSGLAWVNHDLPGCHAVWMG